MQSRNAQSSGQLHGEEYSMDAKVDDGRVDTAARSSSDRLQASFMETMLHPAPLIAHEVPDEVYTSFHFVNGQSN